MGISGEPGTMGWPAAPAYAPPAPARLSALAIAGLVCGAAGLVTCCTMVPSLLGIIFGAVALGPIARGEVRGRGIAITGIVLGTLGLFLGVCIWIVLFRAPSNSPIPGREVSVRDRHTLETLGVLQPDEAIEFLYPTGVFSLRERGAVLTADRIVVWANSTIQTCPLVEIKAISFTPAASWIDDGEFVIERDDGGLLVFGVGSANESNYPFDQVLRQRATEARKAAGKEPVASKLSTAP